MITDQIRCKGVTKTKGHGSMKELDNIHIHGVFDEHAIIYNEDFTSIECRR